MIRLIIRDKCTANMGPHGGTHDTAFRTFDVDLPELEELLRDNDATNQYRQCQVIGAELLKVPTNG